jgi:hypothetical protein
MSIARTRVKATRLAMLLGVVCASGVVDAADAVPDPCTLLSDAEAATALGQKVEQKSLNRLPGGMILSGPSCSWRGKASNFIVGLETRETLTKFTAANPNALNTVSPLEFFRILRKNLEPAIVDLPSVGDQAFWEKTNKALDFMKHGVKVRVEINRHDAWGTSDDMASARALALVVASKL